jgi:hypothetical protein
LYRVRCGSMSPRTQHVGCHTDAGVSVQASKRKCSSTDHDRYRAVRERRANCAADSRDRGRARAPRLRARSMQSWTT